MKFYEIAAQNQQQPFGQSAAAAAELLSAFECPVCMDYMLPPYLQCPAGHLVSTYFLAFFLGLKIKLKFKNIKNRFFFVKMEKY
jgi:hypothetical protein